MLYKKCILYSALCIAVFPLMLNAQNTDSTRTDVFLEDMLKQQPQYFDSILVNRKKYNVQIIYTKIDRGANGIAGLKHYYFNVNSQRYFSPASSVKLPVAILALQKLSELKQYNIDKNTTMLTEKAYSGQTAAFNDPTAPNGKPSLAQYLKRMLMTGDEESCNRLYEFLGQQYINQQLQAKGYARAQITERIGEGLTEDENRHTNPLLFLAPGNKLLYEQAAQFNAADFTATNDSLASRNRLVLEDMHSMLMSLIFPNKVTSSQRFAISDDDRKYILKYMSQLPTESSNPPYIDEPEVYYPAFSKFLLYGSGKDSIPNNTRIFNAAGECTGSVVDVAYVVDFDKKIEFFLSAVIVCDEDEYETLALPFMKRLGEVIYEYEVKREKRIVPDLSDVRMLYDGR